MQFITIHCQPTLLDTIKQLGLDYTETLSEVNVNIPYTKENEDVNNKYSDDVEFVNHYGLDYDQVNCIELI